MTRLALETAPRSAYTGAMNWWRLIAVLFFTPLAAAGVKVAALHPLLGDLARETGGGRVEVADLLRPTGNPHTFEPTARELAAAADAAIVLATGKRMEPYLDRLRDSLPPQTLLLDLGAAIPDAEVPCPRGAEEGAHGHGANDPHWWHTPANMKRAARRLAAALEAIDPEGRELYRARLKEWNRRMDRLDAEARTALAGIPPERRVLATAHASMCHFCREYGFTPLPLQGVSAQDEGHAAALAAVLAELRRRRAGALFTEMNAPPKMLETIARQLHVPALPLITDGLHPELRTFEAIFRHNVKTIAEGLTPAPRDAAPAP
ncbi:MAG: metal ABC transporter substrate-binding protein [Akkermansia sp.]|nr:metal ABC transporter substrate-binding protein [Akkermansia sp.]